MSTSTSADVASAFGSNIYVIRPPANAIDLNAALGSANPFPDELEVAIIGVVDPSQIRGVTIPSQGLSILNPNYDPSYVP